MHSHWCLLAHTVGVCPVVHSTLCTAVSGGKSRKRSAASAASWEDEDPVQDAGDALDLTEDDVGLSMVSACSSACCVAP